MDNLAAGQKTTCEGDEDGERRNADVHEVRETSESMVAWFVVSLSGRPERGLIAGALLL